MTEDDLDSLLSSLEEATANEVEKLNNGAGRLRLPKDKKAVGQKAHVPIVKQGKIIGYQVEEAPDYRLLAEQSTLRWIRELRVILRQGGDLYRGVALALSIGASTTLADAMRGRFSSIGSDDGINGRTIPSQDQSILRVEFDREKARLKGVSPTELLKRMAKAHGMSDTTLRRRLGLRK